MIEILTARQLQAYKLRIIEGNTFSEAGKKMGVSGERVRQLTKKATEKIRSYK